ncbi:phosphatidylglycerol/phosphatidylinositol transfer protein [Phanerochaete sordida]|uniref:Phosphatidylglycerol/phosphatidylinositol transfer protein n=1 Tax=Phanerochaete sordida TaxID=48140 RepID=A0A9P3G4W2_9APHY|nr:phosphatidylglycerol/phosphatidylinositol transfer protein [Phanerochaete sordida]
MARFSFLALLAAVSASFVAAGPAQDPLQASVSDRWSWTQCGDPETDPLKVISIEISPDPPKPGEDLTVNVVGEAREKIEDGAYADVVVKVGAIKILQKEFDLCEEARNAHANISCPVEKGEHTVEHTVTLPKEIPPAPFKVHIDGWTVEDEPLVCVDIAIDFRKPRAGLW